MTRFATTPNMTSEQEDYGDIEKRLEGLKLDDKSYDECRIDKRLNDTEPEVPSKQEISQRDSSTPPQLSEEDLPTKEEATVPPASVDDKQMPATIIDEVTSPAINEEPRKKSAQTFIRFRRPVLTTDTSAPMQDSYEAITLSELQQLDAEAQLHMEESSLALGDFEEEDEFEEVDEFDEDDNWEGVGVDAEWDGDEDVYCGDDADFLDDRD